MREGRQEHGGRRLGKRGGSKDNAVDSGFSVKQGRLMDGITSVTNTGFKRITTGRGSRGNWGGRIIRILPIQRGRIPGSVRRKEDMGRESRS